MFAGKVHDLSKETMNLIANPLALDINGYSSALSATYQGDCACRPIPHQSEWACDPYNRPGSPSCVAVWIAKMPNKNCRAIAVLNLGNHSGTATLPVASIGLGAGAVYVTNVYDHTSTVGSLSGQLSQVEVVGQGGQMLLVAAAGVAAEACATAERAGEPLSSSSCSSAKDCELLGDCVAGQCVCHPGFKGKSCGTVDLAPLSATTGGIVWPPSLMGEGEAAAAQESGATNTTFSWGFTVVYSPEDKLYHAAVNVGCCGLSKQDHWPSATVPTTCGVTVGGTLLVHVVSKFPDRDFALAGIFTAPTAFNPHLIRASNGTYILYFRVNDMDEYAACTGTSGGRVNSSTLKTLIDRKDITHTDPSGEGPGANMYVSYAEGMKGPWTTSRVAINGMGSLHISNPSIALLADGKVMLAYR